MELPTFSEEDPIEWITRAKTYFEVQSASQGVKIKFEKLSTKAQVFVGSIF